MKSLNLFAIKPKKRIKIATSLPIKLCFSDAFGGVVIQLLALGAVIGHLELYETKGRFYETHSFLQEDVRGLGLGILLYDTAISSCLKQGVEIRSSKDPSWQAIRLWRSKTLRAKYNIKKQSDFYGSRYLVLGKR